MITTKDIQESDVSIIICGPIEKEDYGFIGTHNGALQLRSKLPQSELILVTWVGQDLNTPDNLYDKVISLPDPGLTQLKKHSGEPYYINYRRLVYAAYEGAKAASRDWLWRLRSDCVVKNLSIFNEYKAQRSCFKPTLLTFVSCPVLIPEIYTRNCRTANYVGHPSDLMHFGKTGDLRKMFKSCVESRFFGKRLKSYYSSPDDQCAAGAEYAPEQMIWISILERLMPQYTWEPVHNRVLLLNPLSVINHEKAMFANLLIANFDSLGLSFKKAFSAPEHPRSCYTHEEYKTLNAKSRSSPSKYNLQLVILGSTTHYWFLCKIFCSRIKRFLCF